MRAPRKALFIALMLLVLQPFSAIVPQVKASPSGMEQVIFGGHYANPSNVDTTYNSLVGGFLWRTSDLWVSKLVSTDGVIKNLRVVLSDFDGNPLSPGAGKKYTFTLMLNSNPTALTFDIADAATAGSNMVNEITVTGSDRISLQCVPNGTPTLVVASWTSVFEGDTAKESIILGGTNDDLNPAATEYGQVMTPRTLWSNVENDFRQVVPTSGTIKNFYVELSADPGTAPDAYRFTLRKNGASQTLMVTITADAKTGSDLVNSFAVVAGDVLTLMVEPLSTPLTAPYARWGMTFVADIDGESIVLGGCRNSPDSDFPNYNFLTPYGDEIWSLWERLYLGQVCTLKKLYFLLSDAPGAGNSYEFSIRVAGADSDVGVFISGLETTGHSSANVKADIANDDHVTLRVVPTSSPGAAGTYWGLVCYTGPPLPPPPYTEKTATFAIAADAAWTDYDLFTNLGVPKGAIAEIVCANKNTDFARITGVRTDGSALNRYIDLHEAEGLGVTTANMFVKCHKTTGLIECYSEIQGDVEFYLLGYFNSSFDFTESFISLGQPGLDWTDIDLTASGVPDDAVVQILMGNGAVAADFFAGVRENGAVLERGYILDEAENAAKGPGEAWSTLSMVVQSDAGAIIEWKGGSVTDVSMWLLGWFGDSVSFTERFTDYSPVADSVWESKTIVEAAENSVVVFALMHQDAGAETFCGLREEGSVLARVIEEHEAEGGASTGFQACVTLDSEKKCKVYCEDASEAHFYYTGYFIITLLPVKPNIPSLVVIYFNTTMAGEWCGVYAEFFDTEGLYGYIFWNNATSAPGGVNSSFTSMTGTSNSTQENVTLPSSGTLFGCKYYVNDTDGYWGRDTLAMFPTASVAGDTIIMGASGVFWIIFIIIVPIVGYVLKKG